MIEVCGYKFAAIAEKLSDEQKRKIMQAAKMKGMSSQEELARKMGISVKTLRALLKENGTSWRQPYYKVKTKRVKDTNIQDDRRNPYYYNAKTENKTESPWGNGYLNIR